MILTLFFNFKRHLLYGPFEYLLTSGQYVQASVCRDGKGIL